MNEQQLQNWRKPWREFGQRTKERTVKVSYAASEKTAAITGSTTSAWSSSPEHF